MKEEDLIQLRNIFMDEASELFVKIEKNLLAAEQSPDDPTLIAALFRSIHTLKGSSGMIGSKKVTDFIHNLESIFDKIRSGMAPLTPEIIDCTLQCMDHVKVLIVDPELKKDKDQTNDQALTDRINQILSGSAKWATAQPAQTQSAVGRHTYYVYFKPHAHFLKDGSNPLLLIEELTEIGDTLVYAHIDMGQMSDYDPTLCYTSWQVVLSTDEPMSNVQEVFIFTQDEDIKEVKLLSNEDLLANPRFVQRMPKPELGADLTQEKIHDIIKGLEQEVEPVETDSATKVDAISNIRVASTKLDELMNQVSELITSQAALSLYAKNHFDPNLEVIADNMEKIARQLRDTAFDMTLLEIDHLFTRFHRSVRDIATQLDKSVHFVTEGGDTELDKTIIDNLADPLMHLIRNSLDHGIETKSIRAQRGKPEKGTILLKAYYSGAKVYVQIKDDGKGIDVEKIKQKALKNEIIKESDQLTDKELLNLIFVPGFSMAKDVTDLSGRGVGMDVVKKNVLDLRGDISVESVLGEGTTITIGLPLTLSVIDGLQVKVHDTDYIIPLGSVEKCFELKRSSFVNDFNQVVSLDEQQYPYIDLRGEFQISEDNAPVTNSIILVKDHEREVGFCVDEIVGEYQAVLKPVGKYYRDQEFVSGATILGDGKIALVLDTNNLISKKHNNLKLAAS
ncbi:two-component system, chemotaxis family, sensor kinase CheA [Reichenbachiella agariperforans]|uniref:Chemotaxis protein CheA n=1 Tax=Reichenbachiella agariperforans TaxID=156994 RepID=A0A1M6T0J6_REIAG|nr:chemotaxis protein CheA [Reichenbachiella agariperforans]SHK50503.1 two-component system, chemotaxis family, sensor kinase CheA [Reichenbachiella agariperforans]